MPIERSWPLPPTCCRGTGGQASWSARPHSPGGTESSRADGVTAAGPAGRAALRSTLDQGPGPSTRSREPRWGYLRIRGELLKLGVDISATTIATVLRQGGLGPAPRRIGPTWTQFLRLQAYGLLSTGAQYEEDERLEELAMRPLWERPVPLDDGPPIAADPPHVATSVPNGQLSPSVSTPHPQTPVPPHTGTRARDRPAIAA